MVLFLAIVALLIVIFAITSSKNERDIITSTVTKNDSDESKFLDNITEVKSAKISTLDDLEPIVISLQEMPSEDEIQMIINENRKRQVVTDDSTPSIKWNPVELSVKLVPVDKRDDDSIDIIYIARNTRRCLLKFKKALDGDGGRGRRSITMNFPPRHEDIDADDDHVERYYYDATEDSKQDIAIAPLSNADEAIANYGDTCEREKRAITRWDRENQMLVHLWTVYTAICENKYNDLHRSDNVHTRYFAQENKAGRNRNGGDELAYFVNLALINLLDANDAERLAQLGSILLLHVTEQFSEYLQPVFKSFDPHVLFARLRTVSSVCRRMHGDFQVHVGDGCSMRHVQIAIPQLRRAPHRGDQRMMHNIRDETIYRRIVVGEHWRPIFPRLRANMFIAKQLSRVCSSNGTCLEVPDNLLNSDNIPSSLRWYVNNAWSTTSMDGRLVSSIVLCADGTVVSYVRNNDAILTQTVQLRRLTVTDLKKVNDRRPNKFTFSGIRQFDRSMRLDVTVRSFSLVSTSKGIVTLHPITSNDDDLVRSLPVVDRSWYDLAANVPPRQVLLTIIRPTLAASPSLVPEERGSLESAWFEIPDNTIRLSSLRTELTVRLIGRADIRFNGDSYKIVPFDATDSVETGERGETIND